MKRSLGFSLLETIAAITILALTAALLVPLASSVMDVDRAAAQTDELRDIYIGMVGDRNANTFGYLGDVGDYPGKLLDLINPSPVPTGWNGPYINAARIENSILYDRFGMPIEFFRPLPPAVPTVQIDQVAVISAGQDRMTTNTAPTNPNQSSQFAGSVLPSPLNSLYAAATGNTDNITYPKFTDNPSLLNYQSLGQVIFNIRDYDDNGSVAGLAPGCPNAFDIAIASVPRATITAPYEAYMSYAPGGAVVDLVQGLYLVKVLIPGSSFAIWQEQIAVQPGSTLTRDLTLPGVNSSNALGTVVLTLVNSSGSSVKMNEYTTGVGGTISSPSSPTNNVHRCARMTILDASTNATIDMFMMPSGSYTRRYISPAPAFVNLTVTNDGPQNMVAVYDDGILIGTVGKKGNRRVKVFSVRNGDSITVKDETNSTMPGTPFVLSGSITKNY